MVAIGLSSFVAIWAAAGLVDAVNKLPLIGGLLEGVGLVVSGWFIYRNLIFGPDRSVPVTCAPSCSRCHRYALISSTCLHQHDGAAMSDHPICGYLHFLHFMAAPPWFELAEHPQSPWQGTVPGEPRFISLLGIAPSCPMCRPTHLYIRFLNACLHTRREELRKNIDDFLKKVTGKMDASVKKVNDSLK